ncbi:class I SAM-dependent methyltransferase [Candidatus Omnitrophota bacterium]
MNPQKIISVAVCLCMLLQSTVMPMDRHALASAQDTLRPISAHNALEAALKNDATHGEYVAHIELGSDGQVMSDELATANFISTSSSCEHLLDRFSSQRTAFIEAISGHTYGEIDILRSKGFEKIRIEIRKNVGRFSVSYADEAADEFVLVIDKRLLDEAENPDVLNFLLIYDIFNSVIGIENRFIREFVIEHLVVRQFQHFLPENQSAIGAMLLRIFGIYSENAWLNDYVKILEQSIDTTAPDASNEDVLTGLLGVVKARNSISNSAYVAGVGDLGSIDPHPVILAAKAVVGQRDISGPVDSAIAQALGLFKSGNSSLPCSLCSITSPAEQVEPRGERGVDPSKTAFDNSIGARLRNDYLYTDAELNMLGLTFSAASPNLVDIRHSGISHAVEANNLLLKNVGFGIMVFESIITELLSHNLRYTLLHKDRDIALEKIVSLRVMIRRFLSFDQGRRDEILSFLRETKGLDANRLIRLIEDISEEIEEHSDINSILDKHIEMQVGFLERAYENQLHQGFIDVGPRDNLLELIRDAEAKIGDIRVGLQVEQFKRDGEWSEDSMIGFWRATSKRFRRRVIEDLASACEYEHAHELKQEEYQAKLVYSETGDGPGRNLSALHRLYVNEAKVVEDNGGVINYMLRDVGIIGEDEERKVEWYSRKNNEDKYPEEEEKARQAILRLINFLCAHDMSYSDKRGCYEFKSRVPIPMQEWKYMDGGGLSSELLRDGTFSDSIFSQRELMFRTSGLINTVEWKDKEEQGTIGTFAEIVEEVTQGRITKEDITRTQRIHTKRHLERISKYRHYLYKLIAIIDECIEEGADNVASLVGLSKTKGLEVDEPLAQFILRDKDKTCERLIANVESAISLHNHIHDRKDEDIDQEQRDQLIKQITKAGDLVRMLNLNLPHPDFERIIEELAVFARETMVDIVEFADDELDELNFMTDKDKLESFNPFSSKVIDEGIFTDAVKFREFYELAEYAVKLHQRKYAQPFADIEEIFQRWGSKLKLRRIGSKRGVWDVLCRTDAWVSNLWTAHRYQNSFGNAQQGDVVVDLYSGPSGLSQAISEIGAGNHPARLIDVEQNSTALGIGRNQEKRVVQTLDDISDIDGIAGLVNCAFAPEVFQKKKLVEILICANKMLRLGGELVLTMPHTNVILESAFNDLEKLGFTVVDEGIGQIELDDLYHDGALTGDDRAALDFAQDQNSALKGNRFYAIILKKQFSVDPALAKRIRYPDLQVQTITVERVTFKHRQEEPAQGRGSRRLHSQDDLDRSLTQPTIDPKHVRAGQLVAFADANAARLSQELEHRLKSKERYEERRKKRYNRKLYLIRKYNIFISSRISSMTREEKEAGQHGMHRESKKLGRHLNSLGPMLEDRDLLLAGEVEISDELYKSVDIIYGLLAEACPVFKTHPDFEDRMRSLVEHSDDDFVFPDLVDREFIERAAQIWDKDIITHGAWFTADEIERLISLFNALKRFDDLCQGWRRILRRGGDRSLASLTDPAMHRRFLSGLVSKYSALDVAYMLKGPIAQADEFLMLDIGARTGDFAESLHQEGVEIDGSRVRLIEADAHFGFLQVERSVQTDKIVATPRALPIVDEINKPSTEEPTNVETFDLLTAFFLVNHISGDEICAMFKKAYRILKDGGEFVLTLPHSYRFPEGFLAALDEMGFDVTAPVRTSLQVQEDFIDKIGSSYHDRGFGKIVAITVEKCLTTQFTVLQLKKRADKESKDVSADRFKLERSKEQQRVEPTDSEGEGESDDIEFNMGSIEYWIEVQRWILNRTRLSNIIMEPLERVNRDEVKELHPNLDFGQMLEDLERYADLFTLGESAGAQQELIRNYAQYWKAGIAMFDKAQIDQLVALYNQEFDMSDIRKKPVGSKAADWIFSLNSEDSKILYIGLEEADQKLFSQVHRYARGDAKLSVSTLSDLVCIHNIFFKDGSPTPVGRFVAIVFNPKYPSGKPINDVQLREIIADGQYLECLRRAVDRNQKYIPEGIRHDIVADAAMECAKRLIARVRSLYTKKHERDTVIKQIQEAVGLEPDEIEFSDIDMGHVSDEVYGVVGVYKIEHNEFPSYENVEAEVRPKFPDIEPKLLMRIIAQAYEINKYYDSLDAAFRSFGVFSCVLSYPDGRWVANYQYTTEPLHEDDANDPNDVFDHAFDMVRFNDDGKIDKAISFDLGLGALARWPDETRFRAGVGMTLDALRSVHDKARLITSDDFSEDLIPQTCLLDTYYFSRFTPAHLQNRDLDDIAPMPEPLVEAFDKCLTRLKAHHTLGRSKPKIDPQTLYSAGECFQSLCIKVISMRLAGGSTEDEIVDQVREPLIKLADVLDPSRPPLERAAILAVLESSVTKSTFNKPQTGQPPAHVKFDYAVRDCEHDRIRETIPEKFADGELIDMEAIFRSYALMLRDKTLWRVSDEEFEHMERLVDNIAKSRDINVAKMYGDRLKRYVGLHGSSGRPLLAYVFLSRHLSAAKVVDQEIFNHIQTLQSHFHESATFSIPERSLRALSEVQLFAQALEDERFNSGDGHAILTAMTALVDVLYSESVKRPRNFMYSAFKDTRNHWLQSLYHYRSMLSSREAFPLGSGSPALSMGNVYSDLENISYDELAGRISKEGVGVAAHYFSKYRVLMNQEQLDIFLFEIGYLIAALSDRRKIKPLFDLLEVFIEPEDYRRVMDGKVRHDKLKKPPPLTYRASHVRGILALRGRLGLDVVRERLDIPNNLFARGFIIVSVARKEAGEAARELLNEAIAHLSSVAEIRNVLTMIMQDRIEKGDQMDTSIYYLLDARLTELLGTKKGKQELEEILSLSFQENIDICPVLIGCITNSAAIREYLLNSLASHSNPRFQIGLAHVFNEYFDRAQEPAILALAQMGASRLMQAQYKGSIISTLSAALIPLKKAGEDALKRGLIKVIEGVESSFKQGLKKGDYARACLKSAERTIRRICKRHDVSDSLLSELFEVDDLGVNRFDRLIGESQDLLVGIAIERLKTTDRSADTVCDVIEALAIEGAVRNDDDKIVSGDNVKRFLIVRSLYEGSDDGSDNDFGPENILLGVMSSKSAQTHNLTDDEIRAIDEMDISELDEVSPQRLFDLDRMLNWTMGIPSMWRIAQVRRKLDSAADAFKAVQFAALEGVRDAKPESWFEAGSRSAFPSMKIKDRYDEVLAFIESVHPTNYISDEVRDEIHRAVDGVFVESGNHKESSAKVVDYLLARYGFEAIVEAVLYVRSQYYKFSGYDAGRRSVVFGYFEGLAQAFIELSLKSVEGCFVHILTLTRMYKEETDSQRKVYLYYYIYKILTSLASEASKRENETLWIKYQMLLQAIAAIEPSLSRDETFFASNSNIDLKEFIIILCSDFEETPPELFRAIVFDLLAPVNRGLLKQDDRSKYITGLKEVRVGMVARSTTEAGQSAQQYKEKIALFDQLIREHFPAEAESIINFASEDSESYAFGTIASDEDIRVVVRSACKQGGDAMARVTKLSKGSVYVKYKILVALRSALTDDESLLDSKQYSERINMIMLSCAEQAKSSYELAIMLESFNKIKSDLLEAFGEFLNTVARTDLADALNANRVSEVLSKWPSIKPEVAKKLGLSESSAKAVNRVEQVVNVAHAVYKAEGALMRKMRLKPQDLAVVLATSTHYEQAMARGFAIRDDLRDDICGLMSHDDPRVITACVRIITTFLANYVLGEYEGLDDEKVALIMYKFWSDLFDLLGPRLDGRLNFIVNNILNMYPKKIILDAFSKAFTTYIYKTPEYTLDSPDVKLSLLRFKDMLGLVTQNTNTYKFNFDRYYAGLASGEIPLPGEKASSAGSAFSPIIPGLCPNAFAITPDSSSAERGIASAA